MPCALLCHSNGFLCERAGFSHILSLCRISILLDPAVYTGPVTVHVFTRVTATWGIIFGFKSIFPSFYMRTVWLCCQNVSDLHNSVVPEHIYTYMCSLLASRLFLPWSAPCLRKKLVQTQFWWLIVIVPSSNGKLFWMQGLIWYSSSLLSICFCITLTKQIKQINYCHFASVKTLLIKAVTMT